MTATVIDTRDTAATTVATVLDALGITAAVGVADSQLAAVLTELTSRIDVSFTTREDVAVAMAVGAELVGRRHAVFMKNAGIGTSSDAIVSVGHGLGVPLTLVVGWAGSGTDHLAHHIVMGDRTIALLEALEVEPIVVDADGNDTAAISERATACRADGRSCALVVVP